MENSKRGKRSKTSISVNPALWREFGAKLRLEGVEYGDALEELIKEFLQRGSEPRATHVPSPAGGTHDPAITPQNPEQREMVAAVLMALRDDELCEVHKPVLYALLDPEIKKLPKTYRQPRGRKPKLEEGAA